MQKSVSQSTKANKTTHPISKTVETRNGPVLSSTEHKNSKLPITGVILCGGQSKRMGRPKAFLPYAGKTLIESTMDLMSELFDEVLLVTNNPEEFEHLSANVVRDIIPKRGPLVGILSGLLVARNEHCFVAPCDMPFLNSDLLLSMAARRNTADLLVYSSDKVIEPLLAIYSKSCIESLEEVIFQGKDAARDFVISKNAQLFEFQRETKNLIRLPHFNVDTPSQFGQLCAMV